MLKNKSVLIFFLVVSQRTHNENQRMAGSFLLAFFLFFLAPFFFSFFFFSRHGRAVYPAKTMQNPSDVCPRKFRCLVSAYFVWVFFPRKIILAPHSETNLRSVRFQHRASVHCLLLFSEASTVQERLPRISREAHRELPVGVLSLITRLVLSATGNTPSVLCVTSQQFPV